MSLNVLAGLKTNSTVYVLKGATAILECNVPPNVKSTWDRVNSRSDQRGDIYILYADGTEINTNLPNFDNLAIVGKISEGNYNLQIQNVSSSDEGVYICSETSIETVPKESKMTLQVKGKHFCCGKIVVHVVIDLNIYFVFLYFIFLFCLCFCFDFW